MNTNTQDNKYSTTIHSINQYTHEYDQQIQNSKIIYYFIISFMSQLGVVELKFAISQTTVLSGPKVSIVAIVEQLVICRTRPFEKSYDDTIRVYPRTYVNLNR
jgi:hypothetical protein